MSKKCTLVWHEAHFEVKMFKKTEVRTTFGRWDVVSRGRRKGLCTLSKVSKTWGFCSSFKSVGRRGTFEEDLQRCILPGRRSTRNMFSRDVRRSGRWFPEKGCSLAHQIVTFAKMILRDRCSISYPGLTFSWQAQYCRQMEWKMEWKNRKTYWHEAALNFQFLKEVSQNCFVSGVVNFENWGSLAKLFRFWRCQVQKLKKSGKIAAFFMLSKSTT